MSTSAAPNLDDHTLSLSPDSLASRLQQSARDSLLLLDLRSFVNFNQGHLLSSINVCVPNSLIKRKNFSLANVESTISCNQSREKFKKREGAEIVLYDGDCDKVKKNNVLCSLVQKLREENLVNSVHYLQGGFQSFVQKFPHFCNVKTETISSDLAPALCFPLRSCPMLAPPLPSSPEFDTEPVEILDFLYVGSQDVANSMETLDQYRLTYILNAAKECVCYFEGNPKFHYKRLDLLDHACQNLNLELFEDAFRFIDEAKNSGQRVLVHCRAGQSRSATIVISYLIRTHRWTLDRAYKFVQEKRPSVSPNLGFMAQLVQFEKVILGHCTTMQQLIPEGPSFNRNSGPLAEFVPIDCK